MIIGTIARTWTQRAIPDSATTCRQSGYFVVIHPGMNTTLRRANTLHLLLEHGIYMTPSNGLHWVISTAHSEGDIAALVGAADRACS